jgi:hypothetical protein
VRVENKHDGYAPLWRPALTPPIWVDARDQKFESGSLHRRVGSEPDFRGRIPSIVVGDFANANPAGRFSASHSSMSMPVGAGLVVSPGRAATPRLSNIAIELMPKPTPSTTSSAPAPGTPAKAPRRTTSIETG